MMGKRTIRSVGLALALAGFLMAGGCQPTTTSTPTTTKPAEQKPDTKSSSQPKHDPG